MAVPVARTRNNFEVLTNFRCGLTGPNTVGSEMDGLHKSPRREGHY